MKIVILGLHHDHVWDHLRDIEQSPNASLLGIAEPNASLRAKAEEAFHCPTVEDYAALLTHPEAEVAYVFTDNRQGAHWTQRALERGLHVMVEKPMAADLQGAGAAMQAWRASGRRLMVNWPIAWSRAIQEALTMAARGDLGRVWQVKYRAAHAGPKELGCSDAFCEWLFDAHRNGGGALIDYACYGCALARTILGRPDSVVALAGNYVKTTLPVEDNATLLLRYPRASALAEASWTQSGDLTSYQVILYGEEATVIASPLDEDSLVISDRSRPRGVPVALPADVPQHMKNATEHLLWSLEEDAPLMPLVTPEVAYDTQAILEAAWEAVKQGGVTIDAPPEGA